MFYSSLHTVLSKFLCDEISSKSSFKKWINKCKISDCGPPVSHRLAWRMMKLPSLPGIMLEYACAALVLALNLMWATKATKRPIFVTFLCWPLEKKENCSYWQGCQSCQRLPLIIFLCCPPAAGEVGSYRGWYQGCQRFPYIIFLCCPPGAGEVGSYWGWCQGCQRFPFIIL